jgi:sulfate/thiosulfate-binding protein
MVSRRTFVRLSLFGAASRVALALAMLALTFASSCLPQPPSSNGGRGITLSGFSIMKESLEKAIFPAFSAKWKQEHGEEVHFTTSFAGSETVTTQILQGHPSQVAILSIERDADRLQQGSAVTSDWRALPNHGIVNKTPFVILVREGNPKGIRDFADLANAGVRLIYPNPASSGGAQWSVLAIYGSELIKSEMGTGTRDEARALAQLRAIWRNVISTPDSAREARTQFETSKADALITYELEGLLMKQAGAPVEIVVPQATVFSEHPVVVIDRNVTEADRSLINAFVQFLWSEEAQRAFVQYNFRSVMSESLNDAKREFARIEMPFTVEYFGGWSRAYPEVIERVWREQVQKAK